jgi:hypothetical protein
MCLHPVPMAFISEKMCQFMEEGDQETEFIQVAIYADAVRFSSMGIPVVAEDSLPLSGYREVNFMMKQVILNSLKATIGYILL